MVVVNDELKIFIENFTDQFDVVPSEPILPDDALYDLAGRDSMTALNVIAMVDAHYGVQLKGDDIEAAHTVKDLFDRIRKMV